MNPIPQVTALPEPDYTTLGSNFTNRENEETKIESWVWIIVGIFFILAVIGGAIAIDMWLTSIRGRKEKNQDDKKKSGTLAPVEQPIRPQSQPKQMQQPEKQPSKPVPQQTNKLEDKTQDQKPKDKNTKLGNVKQAEKPKDKSTKLIDKTQDQKSKDKSTKVGPIKQDQKSKNKNQLIVSFEQQVRQPQAQTPRFYVIQPYYHQHLETYYPLRPNQFQRDLSPAASYLSDSSSSNKCSSDSSHNPYNYYRSTQGVATYSKTAYNNAQHGIL